MRQRQQNQTTYPLFVGLVLSSDHITGGTGLTPTVTISKNGGAFASPAGAVTEVGNGIYKIAGNATDENTLGELWIHATGTGCDPTDTFYVIVPWDPFDAVRMGLTALANAAAGASGGLAIVGSNVGAATSVSGAVGSVTGAVGSVTGAVGSVTGAVGSIATGGIAAASFAAGAIDAAALGATAGAEIADAVCDELLAGHVIAGSLAAGITSAIALGDPCAIPVPGEYAAGTLGAVIGRRLNSATVEVTSSVTSDGDEISMISGDSYSVAGANQLSFTGASWPSITGSVVTLTFDGTTPLVLTGTVSSSTACYFTLTAANSTTLGVSVKHYYLKAVLTGGEIVTLVRGTAKIVAR